MPAAKRRYGYFCLPLLWGQVFAGRMDVKMDRKSATLIINHLYLETQQTEAFLSALQPALQKFMAFNQAQTCRIDLISGNDGAYSPSTVEQLGQQLGFGR